MATWSWPVRLGLRGRTLVFAAALLFGAMVVGLFAQRAVLYQRHESDTLATLLQSRTELERLASGNNPNTGQPFGPDAAAIFDTYLSRTVPVDGEAFLTFVDGRPYSKTPAPVDLDTLTPDATRWATLHAGERGVIDTTSGPLYFEAVPLLDESATTNHGVFVVAMFLDEGRGRINSDLRIQALVMGIIAAAALLVAWLSAGRLLSPLREMSNTARSITERDLSQRINIDDDDEVGELAATFNDMLDRLETAFGAQRTFIDDAGHELRTPITIIMGQLELMGDSPQDRAATLAVVNDELDRMARIVEDLLVLAKAEQPNFVHLQPIALDEFTPEVFVKARSLGERNWVFDGTAHDVYEGDPQRLTQAMLNLARNAVEHSDPGSTVALGSERRGDDLHLWVRDEGTGIAAEDHDRLFERFARGRNARRRSDGAGLGLSIVGAIVAAHGGRVDLDSTPGEGSRFDIVLPAPVELPSDQPQKDITDATDLDR